MGEVDIEILYEIYRACAEFSVQESLRLNFKLDTGHFETAIEFYKSDCSHPPVSNNRESVRVRGSMVLTPDILVLNGNKPQAIIEYEEETGPRKTGAKYARKGHGHEGDYCTKKDERRNGAYKSAGLSVFRLWESTYKDGHWRGPLFEFLIDCSKRPKDHDLK